ncbi:MAG: hypothetical protein BWY43_00605 [candidate division WS2 bacterium ADurb.Bin280]|uniref:Uncharacterized protein n=1 Tax=candidate division WS2 bacterium ADurb.Bin280 TaxID=1852829 RepID=A0A1V5SDA0_9BACT|nr:MAG: hypothetical protein BWY43_00605 [candidate division WS2 bacterium ADurb.Bin280]
MSQQTETVSRAEVLAKEIDEIALVRAAERWVAAVVSCNGIKLTARSNQRKDDALLAAIRGSFSQHNGGQGVEERDVVAIRNILIEVGKVVVATEALPYVGNGENAGVGDRCSVPESADAV